MFALPSYAQGYDNLVITDNHDRHTQIMLDQGLQVVIENHNLVARLWGPNDEEPETLFDADLSKVASVAFFANSVDGVPTTAADVMLHPDFHGSVLRVKGDTEVTIADTDGRVLDRVAVHGQAEIDMTRYGRGIRIATAQGTTSKFTVR